MKKPEDAKLIDHSTSLELVKMYYDEWKYRHENFWKRLIQFAIITFFTTSMPITYHIFDGLVLPRISQLLFPICGIILAFIGSILCLSEYKRLEAVGNTIKRIIEDDFGEEYAKEELTAQEWLKKIINTKIGIWIPCILMVMQLALACLIIWMIIVNRI